MVIMLCAVIGIFIVYKMAQSMNDAKEAREAAELAAQESELMIAEYDYRDAVALSYTKRGGDTVSVEIQNSRWTYTDDPTLPLNQTTVAMAAQIPMMLTRRAGETALFSGRNRSASFASRPRPAIMAAQTRTKVKFSRTVDHKLFITTPQK